MADPPDLPAVAGADLAAAGPDPLALSVAAWLDSKQGRSGSTRTRDTYAAILADARGALVSVHLDLASPPRAVALALQGWSRRSKVSGRSVKPATVAQRLAVVSSYYEFVIRRGLLDLTANPATLVDRPQVEAYAQARALDQAAIRAALGALRQAAAGAGPAGDLAARDLALLRVALTTGRRVGELAALRWRDVEVTGDGALVTLTFRRAKGGKVLRDALAPAVAADLLAWLHRRYGAALGALDPEAALWPALRHGGKAGRARLGEPLGGPGLAELVQRRLGSHPHALRHSFAHGMRRAGARDSEVQARLGHANLATTGRYLAQLDRAENPFAPALAAMFDGEP